MERTEKKKKSQPIQKSRREIITRDVKMYVLAEENVKII